MSQPCITLHYTFDKALRYALDAMECTDQCTNDASVGVSVASARERCTQCFLKCAFRHQVKKCMCESDAHKPSHWVKGW